MTICGCQTVPFSIERSGLPSEMVAHYLNVPSNIKVGAIGSQTIAEDTKLEGIVVAYSDDNTVANTISVSGACDWFRQR
ncbi:hypothetical protein [Shewanella sedimentimangrovi]|uniref:Uncharacterized protein n=1 Tax=Shewanella sedimentimangrovi TaxID=2814293 RepID=A0ABX7R5T7_9GAMM|nr:hypothetical protein [Shewanella sedimentimangrovi]QSX38632.1 hypothetical protein JYB85_07415 [Shewanella sedimentimangrovi]